jgi:hypothetical protein
MNHLFESITSILGNIYLLSFIFLIFVFLYIKSKSQSGFSILNRLWIFAIKNKETSKDDLINEIMEVEKFNFYYNTNAVSKKQKKKFEDWIRKYELDFKIISKLKDNFDVDSLKIRKIKKPLIAIPFLFLFAIFLCFISAIPVAIKPSGLISINDDGWFWFNKNEAMEYSFFTKRENLWIVTPEMCNNRQSISKKLNTKTIESICFSFKSKHELAYINKLIKKQRWFFGPLSIILFIVMLVLLSKVISLTSTYYAKEMILIKIRKHRKNRKIKTT